MADGIFIHVLGKHWKPLGDGDKAKAHIVLNADGNLNISTNKDGAYSSFTPEEAMKLASAIIEGANYATAAQHGLKKLNKTLRSSFSNAPLSAYDKEAGIALENAEPYRMIQIDDPPRYGNPDPTKGEW